MGPKRVKMRVYGAPVGKGGFVEVVTGGYTWFQAVTELYGIGTMPECDKYTYYTSMQPSRTLTAITGPRYGSKTCGNLDFGLIS